ncbi:hypothetical protein [Williamsia sp.]|uniref:hypothetical protein n=1 Tax=Williamsia sp. TaxID=1872085 RepID=UPI002F939487
MTLTDDNLATGRRRDSGGPGAGTVRASRPRSAAAEKALERRRKRLGAEALSSTSRHWQRSEKPADPEVKPALLARVRHAPVEVMRRVPFAVVVAGMLLAGLALTLWLSTKSAQDSYQLGVERAYNEQLSDRRDALKKEYEQGDSAPELSEKASELGMIPGNDKARLVVGPDGRATVVGEIKPAAGDKAPSLNNGPKPTAAKPADDAAPATPTTPGVQGIPVQGTPLTPDAGTATPVTPDAGTATPAPTTPGPAAPTATATPPAYSNVLPPNGGAPVANSGEQR